MADLRSRFIEDYAGGLLNVSRQELASNGEVLSQDGFLTDSTIYVEDGVGTKSGLRLGVGLAEVVDPTTQTGIVNVRYADRTYTKIRDTKIFTTAMASAQAALAESVAESLGNIESAIDYLEIFDAQADTRLSALEAEYTTLSGLVSQNTDDIAALRLELKNDINSLELGTSGDTNNIKLGRQALAKLSNGSSNVAIGFYSLAELYSGNNNIAIGHQAGLNSTEGSNNVLIGADSRLTNPKASNQIILGSSLNNYLWCKTDIYTPAVSDTSLDLSTTDLLEFIKRLNFSRMEESHIVIEPSSLKQAEDYLNSRGYAHSESGTVSNAKLVPIALASISQLLDTIGINISPIVINEGDQNTISPGNIRIEIPPGPGGGETTTLEVPSTAATADDLSNPLRNFERRLFPIGGIIMWSNYGSRGIPTGWVLCDGRNGTPDLRDRFIIGSGGKYLTNYEKPQEPLVPEHTHEAKFNAGLELVSGLKNNMDPNSGPADGTIMADVAAFPDLEELEVATEYGPFPYPVAVSSTGESDDTFKTYPPFYALAFIMRVF